jgi:DUF177 domain-containing protein
MRVVSRTVPAPANWRGELVGVAAGSDLVLDLRMESVSEGVLVSGTVQVTLVGECARCLDALTDDLEVDVQQLYVYPGREVETDAEDDEIGLLVDEYVDLEPLIRDAVVLALPLAPVCREDCPGLCPDCGARLADVEPAHGHQAVDPRWAALGAMMSTDRSKQGSSSKQGSINEQGSTNEQES